MSEAQLCLDLAACPRVHAASARPALPAETVAVQIVDYGPSFDIEHRRVNVARRTPWIFRAAETASRLELGVGREAIYDALLLVFGLADPAEIRARLVPPGALHRVVVRSAWRPEEAAPAEVFDARFLLGGDGATALEALRLQFIAGNAAWLLHASRGRLSPLLAHSPRID